MKKTLGCWVWLMWLGTSGSAIAGPIFVTSASRTVSVGNVSCSGGASPGCPTNDSITSSSLSGPFDGVLNLPSPSVGGFVAQHSDLGPNVLSGNGNAESVVLVDPLQAADLTTSLDVTFTLDHDAEGSLTGELISSEGSGNPTHGSVHFCVDGCSGPGELIFFSFLNPGSVLVHPYSFEGTFRAGTYTFEIETGMSAAQSTQFGFTQSAQWDFVLTVPEPGEALLLLVAGALLLRRPSTRRS